MVTATEKGWPRRHPGWFFGGCTVFGGLVGLLLGVLPSPLRGVAAVVFIVAVVGGACAMAVRALRRQ
jgi:hypothetical protein